MSAVIEELVLSKTHDNVSATSAVLSVISGMPLISCALR